MADEKQPTMMMMVEVRRPHDDTHVRLLSEIHLTGGDSIHSHISHIMKASEARMVKVLEMNVALAIEFIQVLCYYYCR